jgi:hypothetical protein
MQGGQWLENITRPNDADKATLTQLNPPPPRASLEAIDNQPEKNERSFAFCPSKRFASHHSAAAAAF